MPTADASSLHRGPTYVDLLLAAHQRAGEPLDRVAALAHALRAAGVRAGDGVAVLAVGHPHQAAAVTAALSLGARLTMLHPLRPLDQQAAILADARVATLVFDPAIFAEHAATLAEEVGELTRLVELGDDLLAAGAGAPPRVDTSAITEDDVAFVQYTTGTTGTPKGVVATHRCMAHGALMLAAELEWPSEVRFLGCTPLAQVMLLPVRLRGGTYRLLPFDPELVIRTIEEERITALCLAPSMLYALLDTLGSRRADLASLETVFYGSSAIAPARLAEAIDVLGPVLAQVYASTEATHAIATLRKADHDPARPERLGSVGRPVVGVELTVRDADGAEVPDGQRGELCVRGRSVADGYWGRPELTEAVFGRGWFRTGDVGWRDGDGFVTLVDRAEHAIALGDRTVYPREVEDVLATHPGVAQAVVMGTGDGRSGLEAAVTVRPGRELDPAELAALVPELVEVHVLDAIPLNLSGKADRQALRAQLVKLS